MAELHCWLTLKVSNSLRAFLASELDQPISARPPTHRQASDWGAVLFVDIHSSAPSKTAFLFLDSAGPGAILALPLLKSLPIPANSK
ncbi:hypothetical protein FOXYSP1_07659 [Fusarium oxysporum f. sp. phaseoli]